MSKIALNAVGADLLDHGGHSHEMTADFAEARIWPDAGLSVDDGCRVNAGMAAHEADEPGALIFRAARIGPCELSFKPAQFDGQCTFPASRLLVAVSGRGRVMS